VVDFESEKEASFRGERYCSNKQTHVEAYTLQVDAILECDSLTSLMVLAVKSTRLKPKIALVCALWVLINIVCPVTQEYASFMLTLNRPHKLELL